MGKRKQLAAGLLFGMIFGFLLHKGGVTRYDVIMAQLLLRDFTVLKIMMSAVLVGTVGIHLLKAAGRVSFTPKSGSWGQNGIGGLVFGAGFALLGYCPGTVAGALAHGALDVLLAGLPGILIGCWLYAAVYPRVRSSMLSRGMFKRTTLPEMLGVNQWWIISGLVLGISLLFLFLEKAGL